jgi:3-oxoacyl-[acyl-carrier protein] reductase
MSSSQLLNGKHAVVFGAGGSIGAAVAKEFAAEGAQVFLAGRTRSNVEDVAQQIAATGGRAHAAVTDALDDSVVNEHIDRIARHAGTIDIVFSAVGPLVHEYGNTKSATDLTIDEFMMPLTTVVKSQFITARAAARHMVKQHSGVIIFLTGSPARGHVAGATAIGTAFGAGRRVAHREPGDRSQSQWRPGCVPSDNRQHRQPDHSADDGGVGQ